MAVSASLTLRPFHNNLTTSSQILSPSQQQSFSLFPHLPYPSKPTNFPALFSLVRLGNGISGNGRVRVRVSAGYTKRKMETPGAYELIDEESGEKVIVWGGIEDNDDDDSSIPSKEVLSWKPNNSGKKSPRSGSRSGGREPQSGDPDDTFSTVPTGRSASNFGRLKPVKIQSRVKSNSQRKPEFNKEIHDEVDAEVTDDDDNDLDISLDSEDISIRKTKSINRKSGIDQLLDDQQSLHTFQSKAIDMRSASKSPAPRSKGWNDRESTSSYRDQPRDLKYTSKNLAGGDFFSRKTFRDLGCSDNMIESLKAQEFVRPSHIQAMAYIPITEGKSCIIADQSGSGKTLAYLAPVVQRLREEEITGVSKSAPRSPRAVILVPTAELASQVLRNCRSISKQGVPFRSMVATGGFRQRTQLESLEQDLDVLIATPGRFIYLIKEGFLQLTNLQCAVLDEVDILFSDEDFEQAFQSLISSSPITTQYLFVTATLPVEIYNKLVEIFPDCEVIMGPGMHRTSSGLEEVLVDCSGDDRSEKTPETAFSNKKSALLKLAEESPVSRTIVFCNKIETCRKVENVLRRLDRKENQIRILPFHGALEQETRLTNMKEFVRPVTDNRSLFLICTDRASRGIDFPSVDHVVLFDFPRDPSEYVRRVGRTARGAGGKGTAYVFVVGKQVSLARRIIERNLKGHPLHEVPSSYELVR